MPRRQKTFHYIYKTTCLVTGRFYVGMHSTNNLDDGYLGSGKILGYSRKKHGDENHKKEILEMCPSREALKLREKEIVNEEMLADTLNINLKYGGEGGWENVNAARTADDLAVLGRRWRGNSTGNKGVERTKTWCKNLSIAMTGKKPKGGMLGKKHRDDTRARQSKSHSGSNNSQFGTCWVTNGKAIKICRDQLDLYLSQGYFKGRTMPA